MRRSRRALLLWLALSACAHPDSPVLSAGDAAYPVAPDSAAPGDRDAEDRAPEASIDAQLLADASAPADATADRDAGALDGAALEASAPPQAQRRALVDHARWLLTMAGDDPFTDRPPTVVCARAATMPEVLGGEPAFSVDTGSCNYLTAVQPALSGVAAGESLTVRLWHFDLTAPEPAQAHAALTLDGLPVLDETVEIPAPGGLLVRRVVAPRAISQGAPVHFHLHNHGANSWSLVEVSAAP